MVPDTTGATKDMVNEMEHNFIFYVDMSTIVKRIYKIAKLMNTKFTLRRLMSQWCLCG